LLLAFLAMAATAVAGPGVDAYRSWLEREQELVEEAERSHADSNGALPGSLRAARELALRPGPGVRKETTAWLAEDCGRILRAKTDQRPALTRGLLARIRSHRELVAAEPAAWSDPGPALSKVLARTEFAWGPASRSWFGKLRNWVDDLLRRLVFFLVESRIAHWTPIAVAALAAAVFLFFVVWALRDRPRSAGAAAGDTKAGPARPGRWKEDYSRQAEEAYRDGRFREALRLLYVAFLRELDHAGVIRLVKYKTNWDYRREIQANQRDLALIFGPFTELYEAKWYGQEHCTAGHYEAAKRLYDEARGVAR